jgi:ferrous iron transport protein B
MIKVALAGNPNSGKTTLFNRLTGLQQKVGNFPGVTVDRKTGVLNHRDCEFQLIDLPGTYSLHPTSEDERITSSILLQPDDVDYPDLVLYVLDVRSLEQQLLMLTQIMDLGLPVILTVTMIDEWAADGVSLKKERLQQLLSCPVHFVSGKTGENLDDLKDQLVDCSSDLQKPAPFYSLQQQEQFILEQVPEDLFHPKLSPYGRLVTIEHAPELKLLTKEHRDQCSQVVKDHQFNSIKSQVHETMARFEQIQPLMDKVVKRSGSPQSMTDKIDRVVSHPYIGPIIFIGVMLLIFQAIFSWATYPMDGIEWVFASLSSSVQNLLPDAWYTSLITEGILAGLGGVLVFIPQIAILFLLLSLLEEVGYMSRAVYLFDKFMSRFGMNGRSVVAMVSGGACAIPAIMSARTIANPKERLLTILVTPFIPCSARIPVYIVLVGFVVPAETYYGPFNAQGLVFMGLYVFGIVAAFGGALLLRPFVSGQTSGFLMIELPDYRSPSWSTMLLTVKNKVGAFVIEAGKIIFAISIVLWFMASYGPGNSIEQAAEAAATEAQEMQWEPSRTENYIAAKKIEASYAGHLGKWIEPTIAPLGFDWKIGIALLTSFAAREVFVGTMATIYSIGDTADELSVRDRMAKEINPKTGGPRYDLATSISLLLFFALAMQCMSTVAVVKKETNSWKWPILQFVFMTGLAYLASLIAYQILSQI